MVKKLGKGELYGLYQVFIPHLKPLMWVWIWDHLWRWITLTERQLSLTVRLRRSILNILIKVVDVAALHANNDFRIDLDVAKKEVVALEK